MNASSSLLQKSGYLRCTEFILESCETLGERGELRTDKFLRHLIRLQQLGEEVDDVLTENSTRESRNHLFAARIMAVRDKLELLKTHLTFPLSDCRKHPKLFSCLNILCASNIKYSNGSAALTHA